MTDDSPVQVDALASQVLAGGGTGSFFHLGVADAPVQALARAALAAPPVTAELVGLAGRVLAMPLVHRDAWRLAKAVLELVRGE